jgi:hypothetical protein
LNKIKTKTKKQKSSYDLARPWVTVEPQFLFLFLSFLNSIVVFLKMAHGTHVTTLLLRFNKKLIPKKTLQPNGRLGGHYKN